MNFEIRFNQQQKMFVEDFIETYPATYEKLTSIASKKAIAEGKSVVISFFCRHTPTGIPKLILDTEDLDPLKLIWSSVSDKVALSPLNEEDEDCDEYVANVHVILAK